MGPVRVTGALLVALATTVAIAGCGSSGSGGSTGSGSLTSAETTACRTAAQAITRGLQAAGQDVVQADTSKAAIDVAAAVSATRAAIAPLGTSDKVSVAATPIITSFDKAAAAFKAGNTGGGTGSVGPEETTFLTVCKPALNTGVHQ